ncbi:uncharacterized protein At2g33490-like [Olea europaea var. sylvestris]|uniref:uncharacterized protein At2g33490-like n=1 Tax=Olea europaea var. sylvestris TaxID=158386 RepID=UPI000C1D79AD|nr:uncharacterized protein At2g33490-like [Olea europaea var. sylvestris]
MKSPLEKLRKFAPHKIDAKENWDHHISAHLHGLAQAVKDMKDMRTCYDRLLSAAAATTNSAYEFSESLLEMGNCLLEKTAVNNDGESGRALEMLGRVQLELQKLADNYRSHIIKTITNPSESLLSELRQVEEMKLQCDEKREMFEYMVGQCKEKGRSKHGNGEAFTSMQLQTVREEYDEAARLCIFRVESLKQGQCQSLLTQAARHHAAQLNFFRKGLQSLVAVEQHIKNVADRQHIDYELRGMDDGEDGEEERNRYEANDVEELSFDYGQNKQELDHASISRNSMEINIGKHQGEQISSQQPRGGSHSAPIFAEKFDPAERIREMQITVPKLNTHVLPTPVDAMSSITSSFSLLSGNASSIGSTKSTWHSTPLDAEKHRKFADDNFYAYNFSKSNIAVKEKTNNRHSLPLPRPLTEGGAAPKSDIQSGSNTREMERHAFSSSLASKPSSNKSILSTSGPTGSSELPQSVSGLLSRVPVSQSSSVNVFHGAPHVSSPRISELHELPRPPDSFGSKPMFSSGALGHSAPLINRNREASPTNRNPLPSPKEGSSLPLPPLTVPRSLSIPSSRQRAFALHAGKLLESSQIEIKTEKVASPPLTPISL